jgi:glycosyltransferase involved in cell wall biosynthesis
LEIVHVTQALYPHLVGGSPIGIHLLAREETARGHIVVIHTVDYGKLNHEAIPPKSYRVQFHRRIWMPWDWLGTAGNPLAPSIRAAVRRSKATIVHLHSHLFFPSFFGLIGARQAQIPAILTVHGVFARRSRFVNGLQHAWIATLGKFVLKHSVLVVCQTQADAGRIRGFGVAASRIRVVANTCDETEFRPAKELSTSGRVVWVGRHVREKGIRYLLEAWPEVIREFPRCTLVLVGDGPERTNAEEQAARLGILGSVEFHPSREPKEVAQILRESQLFVLPSLQEGLPMALIEAAASALPIVTTEGLRELGPMADYVTPGESRQLAQTILAALRDPHQGRRRGQLARQKFEQEWSIRRLAHRYEEIYMEAIAMHAGTGNEGVP